MSTKDIPREKIPWYPTIDYVKCSISCRVCISFCKYDVFTWGEAENRPIVKNPYNCPVGCNACTEQCPAGAISFMTMDELREMIKKLRSEGPT